MTPPLIATLLDARIDAIAQRQTARFLDRLRRAGNSTPVLERDFMRSIRFLCDDVKAAIHEQSPEAPRDPSPC